MYFTGTVTEIFFAAYEVSIWLGCRVKSDVAAPILAPTSVVSEGESSIFSDFYLEP